MRSSYNQRKAKAVLCIADPLANPLDGFEPPKVAFSEPIPPVTETEFSNTAEK